MNATQTTGLLLDEHGKPVEINTIWNIHGGHGMQQMIPVISSEAIRVLGFEIQAGSASATLNWANIVGDHKQIDAPFTLAARERKIVPVSGHGWFDNDAGYDLYLEATSTQPLSVTITYARILASVQYPTFGVSELTLNDATLSVAHDAGDADIVINRSGDTIGFVGVHMVTANGTAIAGVDYTAVVTNQELNSGEVTSTLAISILNTSPLVDKNFTVTISAPYGRAVLGPTTVCTVTITH